MRKLVAPTTLVVMLGLLLGSACELPWNPNPPPNPQKTPTGIRGTSESTPAPTAEPALETPVQTQSQPYPIPTAAEVTMRKGVALYFPIVAKMCFSVGSECVAVKEFPSPASKRTLPEDIYEEVAFWPAGTSGDTMCFYSGDPDQPKGMEEALRSCDLLARQAPKAGTIWSLDPGDEIEVHLCLDDSIVLNSQLVAPDGQILAFQEQGQESCWGKTYWEFSYRPGLADVLKYRGGEYKVILTGDQYQNTISVAYSSDPSVVFYEGQILLMGFPPGEIARVFHMVDLKTTEWDEFLMPPSAALLINLTVPTGYDSFCIVIVGQGERAVEFRPGWAWLEKGLLKK